MCGGWNPIRDTIESAASLGGNYLLPGSSLLTNHLVSKGSQKQLSSPLGQIAQIGSGLAGAGVGSGFTGLKSASNIGAGWENLGNAVGVTGPGSMLGTSAGNTLPGGIGPTQGSGILGTIGRTFTGNTLPLLGAAGAVAASGGSAARPQQNIPSPGPTAFVPSQSAASSLPPSLSGMSTLTPGQQATSLASQGTFGGGNGPQEEGYYRNLLNRQLVDNGGNVKPISNLAPIESSYNQQLGLGQYKNSNDLLEALSKWKHA